MDVLEALGGWRNINREKLDQIKVDNPPLYDAITKALNLLAKKYGGEDIVIEKPIEKPIEVVSEVEQGYDFTGLWPYADYLRMIEELTEKKGDWVTVDDIVKEKGVPNMLTPQEYYDSQYFILNSLQGDGLVLNVDNEYIVSNKGKLLLIKANGEPIQSQLNTPSDEELKTEILVRMADYYEGNNYYKLLNQDDIITNAVKHKFDIPSNKYFGLVVKLLQEGFVEKDPSDLTDSIRLTANGYDESQGWFEGNKPAQFQPTDLQISILEAVKEASATKIGDGFVSTTEIWPYNKGMMPINYDVFTQNSTTPSLEKDLALLAFNGYLEFASAGTKPSDFRYRLSKKGEDLVSATNTLNDLKGFVEAQPIEEPTQGLNYRRPSPTFSATKYATGVTMVGNDMSLWRVTENKNGVKRWVKVEEPTPKVSQEPPISEIEEDEVDLDILEQQLNDDSLEFDITDEDLDNLEF
jgi:hypothetical protein